jgi:hypothetical protein
MKVDESQYSDDEEFVENVERMELDENSDPESDEGGAEVSFVSNGSTLASSTSQKCGFQGCTNLSTKSRDYKMVNGMREEKAWYSNHKWCSKQHNYESAGKCAYSTQINAKVRTLFKPLFPMTFAINCKQFFTHLLQLLEISRRMLLLFVLELILTV